MKNKRKLWVKLGLLFVAIIWGSGFIATQIAIDEGLSPTFIIFMLIDRDFVAFTSIKGLVAVLYLAVFSTCVAYSIQTVCQRFASPSKVAILISTEALVGSILSVILGFEPFTYFLFIGGIAIIISMLIIEIDFVSPLRSSVD